MPGRIRWVVWLAGCVIAAGLTIGTAMATAAPAWTTYRHDAARSGIDPDSTSPVAPSQIWQSPVLDGDIYGQPLEYGSNVYVATEIVHFGRRRWTLRARAGRDRFLLRWRRLSPGRHRLRLAAIDSAGLRSRGYSVHFRYHPARHNRRRLVSALLP